MTEHLAAGEYAALVADIGGRAPDSEQYQRMCDIVVDLPGVPNLCAMDPFSQEYKAEVMGMYLALRGRAEQGYEPGRDEAPVSALPGNLWTGLVPWSFQSATMASEHVLAWGNILRQLDLAPGGSVLEYGPGSGQLLLMLARLGYAAHGVDVDGLALESIRAQAAHLGLPIQLERAEFGAGFAEQSFDRIVFYEAFHHAFEFEALLVSLHGRLNAGGRLILGGEPIVPAPCDALPYPWGLRLDALSTFCVQRYGWMELGFTHEYFLAIAGRTGWLVEHFPSQTSGRCAIYVLQPRPPEFVALSTEVERPVPDGPLVKTESKLQAEALLLELAAMQASTSWRLTAPLRWVRERIG